MLNAFGAKVFGVVIDFFVFNLVVVIIVGNLTLLGGVTVVVAVVAETD